MKLLKETLIVYLLLISLLISVITTAAPLILLVLICTSNISIIFKILGSLFLPFLTIFIEKFWEWLDDKIYDKP
jgi:hypothetical protein